LVAEAYMPLKKNYYFCERELLAIVVRVQHFHEFLAPKPFVIKTDNSALKYLNTVKILPAN